MADEIRDITVSLKIDTKDVDQKEGKTKQLFDNTNTQIERQNKIIRELNKDLQFQIKLRNQAFNPNDVKKFNNQIRATQNRVVELTRSNIKLRNEVKKTGKTFGRIEKILKNVGVALLAAFSVRAIVGFTKQLIKTAAQMETFQKRAQVVFGESINIVKEFAKQNAISLGLTENEFLGAASAIGDLLEPLVATRQQAAQMSSELLKTAGTLKEFRGDTRSTTEISEILSKSLTGQIDGLKSLDIFVDRTSESFKELVKTKIEDEGVTDIQAKALAIYEIILEQSNEALVVFDENTNSLSKSQAELSANVRTLNEELAILLLPTFKLATEALLENVESINDADTSLGKLGRTLLRTVGPQAVFVSIIDALTKSEKEQVEVLTELDKLLGDAFSATGDLSNARIVEIRNIFFLKNAIKELNEERSLQGTSIERILQIKEELKPLNTELNRLLKDEKDNVEDVDDAWKKLDKTLRRDIRDALRLTKDEFSELDEEFDSIIADLDAFGQKIEEINTLAALRFENIILKTELAGEGVQGLSAIQRSATEERIKQLELLGLSEEQFAEQRKKIVEEGEGIQRALFLFEKILAAQTVILNLQKEISIIGATPLPAPIKAAQILNARLRAGVSLVTIAGTAIAGFAEGTEDAPGGLAMVGEKGRELSYVPKGAKILPNDKTEKYAGVIDSMFRNKFDQYIMERYVPDMLMTDNEGEVYNDHRMRSDVRNSRFNRANAEWIGRSVAKHTSSRAYLMNRYA